MTLIVVLLLGAGSIFTLDAFSSDPQNGGQPYGILALVGSIWQGNAPSLGGLTTPPAPTGAPGSGGQRIAGLPGNAGASAALSAGPAYWTKREWMAQ